ncbi:MAG: hypothetical protein AB2669_00520 [Candidatus Thiodiazotropha endolucinida]
MRPKLKSISIGLSVTMLVLGSILLFSPYRLQQVSTAIDPWEPMSAKGEALTQALIAIGK